MLRKLLSLFLFLPLVAAAQSHRIPATDTTNSWTGANTFQMPASFMQGLSVLGVSAFNGTVSVNGSPVCTSAGGTGCPGAISTSIPAESLLVSGGAGAITGSIPDAILADASIAAVGPKVNIESPIFGTGGTLNGFTMPSCLNVQGSLYGVADPTGSSDSTCAIQNAINYIMSLGANHQLTNQGRPVLYIPHGKFLVGQGLTGQGNYGYTAVFTLPQGFAIEGDSTEASEIRSIATHATLFFFTANAGGCNTASNCETNVSDITLEGAGHTTNASGIEVLNVQNFFMRNVNIANFGGIEISLNGATERSYIRDVDLTQANRALVTEGDTNENYFQRVNVLFSGADETNYFYSRTNCPNGVCTTQKPEYTPLVQIDGVNNHWLDSSIKGTNVLAGIRFVSGEADSLEHTYIEGFTQGSQNPAVQVIGAGEIGTTTASILASTLVIPVNDAIYQPLYLSDPNTLSQLGSHSYVNAYDIFPVDYVANDLTDLSTECAGVTGCNIYKGTKERVQVNAFSADGNAHLFSRATTAYNWPAGSKIEQVISSTYGGGVGLFYNHFESVFSSTASAAGCSDTVPNASWVSNPSDLCAEIIAGALPDGYEVPYPSPTSYVGVNALLLMIGNSQYTGSGENGGEGYVKVPADASVFYENGVYTPQTFPDDTAMSNNVADAVAFVKYGTTSALGEFRDVGSNLVSQPASNFFQQEVRYSQGNTLVRDTNGSDCYGLQPQDGSTLPLYLDCDGPGGWSFQKLVSGAYQTLFGINLSTGLFTGSLVPTLGQPTDQTIGAANATIGTTATNVFLDAGSNSVNATLPTCAAGTTANLTYNLFRSDVAFANSVTLLAPSGNDIQLDGTTTGSSGVTSVNLPPGAYWKAICDNTVNTYYEWRVYTQHSGLANVTFTVASGISATPTPNISSNTETGNVSLVVAGAIAGGAAMLNVVFPSASHVIPLNVDASITGNNGLMLPVGNIGNTGFTIYAPGTGLAAGTYTIQYSSNH